MDAGNVGPAEGQEGAPNLRDNNGGAGRVQAFRHQVEGFLGAGILTQGQADALLGPGNVVRLGVTRR
jgi:hypothetical protein